jgi:hypothetical protein
LEKERAKEEERHKGLQPPHTQKELIIKSIVYCLGLHMYTMPTL